MHLARRGSVEILKGFPRPVGAVGNLVLAERAPRKIADILAEKGLGVIALSSLIVT